MEAFANLNELFQSVWIKGIFGVNFLDIIIGLGIFFIFKNLTALALVKIIPLKSKKLICSYSSFFILKSGR